MVFLYVLKNRDLCVYLLNICFKFLQNSCLVSCAPSIEESTLYTFLYPSIALLSQTRDRALVARRCRCQFSYPKQFFAPYTDIYLLHEVHTLPHATGTLGQKFYGPNYCLKLYCTENIYPTAFFFFRKILIFAFLFLS